MRGGVCGGQVALKRNMTISLLYPFHWINFLELSSLGKKFLFCVLARISLWMTTGKVVQTYEYYTDYLLTNLFNF